MRNRSDLVCQPNDRSVGISRFIFGNAHANANERRKQQQQKQQPPNEFSHYTMRVGRCYIGLFEKRWTFFPSYFFSSSSFLGSEEFYLCNIAIWPIQKKKKKLAHTFGHTNICCLVHAHTCTLGCRILSPDSVKGDYGCAMREKCNEIILFIIEIETKQWNEMDVLDWEWEFILSFRPKLKKNLNFWKNGFIAEKMVFF